MSQSERKTSRIRRPPNYLNSEEEALEITSRLREPSRKDGKQSNLSMSAMSNLLVKFISQSNNYYKEVEKELNKQKKDKERKDKSLDTRTLIFECPREYPKRASNSINLDNQAYRSIKPKKLYSFKTSSLKQFKQEGKYLNSISQLEFPSHLPYQMNPHSSYLMGLSLTPQKQQIHPNIKEYLNVHDPQVMSTSLKTNSFANNHLLQNRNSKSNCQQKNHKPQRNRPTNIKNSLPQRKYAGEEKLFIRASFHVAIAYHIYFKKIQLSKHDPNNNEGLDPTRHAKKLKEQKSKTVQSSENH